jgi:hypothetical protein
VAWQTKDDAKLCSFNLKTRKKSMLKEGDCQCLKETEDLDTGNVENYGRKKTMLKL